MPKPNEVRDLAASLHDAGIVNLQRSASEMLTAVETGRLSDGALAAGWYVVGGEHYVIVCGLTADKLQNVANPGRTLGE
jgi:hypothetical protein